jgi:hypothetical protein
MKTETPYTPPPDVPLVAPSNHHFLNPGEKVTEGDRIRYGDKWVDVTALTIGQLVKHYTGFLRRTS